MKNGEKPNFRVLHGAGAASMDALLEAMIDDAVQRTPQSWDRLFAIVERRRQTRPRLTVVDGRSPTS